MLAWFAGTIETWQWIVALSMGVLLNAFLLAFSLKKGFLTAGGAIIALLMGTTTWMAHPVFFLLLILFFVSSSFLSKVTSLEKADAQDLASKGGTRDAMQVLANGGVACVASFTFLVVRVSGSMAEWVLRVGTGAAAATIASVAAATADTWATEIGTLATQDPAWILDWRKHVAPGTSGGVTKLGTLASLAGSFTIAILGVTIGGITSMYSLDMTALFTLWAATGLAGFAGCFLDSLLGATVQGFYQCQSCGKGTEKRVHCGKETVLSRGNAWFGNDLVNFLATLLAGCIAFIIGAS
ncbi:DUF92 domain-containing protein [Candidatus Bathyarchaeota archaeon]|nr:DUF92 domain-containing protein [Candidatus Bathyarchaeota archaeon]